MKRLATFIALTLLIVSVARADLIDEIAADASLARQRANVYLELQDEEPSEYHKFMVDKTNEYAKMMEAVYDDNKKESSLTKDQLKVALEKVTKEYRVALKKSGDTKKLGVDTYGGIYQNERSAEVIGAKLARLSKLFRDKK